MGFRVLLAGLVLAAAGVGAWVWLRPAPAPARGGCQPPGGLSCAGSRLQMCRDGQATEVGDCPGGCVDEGGVARCRGPLGTLVAPPGAACRAGVALCGLGGNTLLICNEGRLAPGADCPGGCEDHGPGHGIYCKDSESHLRFAPGMSCFEPHDQYPYLCGRDGRELLACRDGTLVVHTVACEQCLQSRGGALTCLGEWGTPLDPASGVARP